MFTTHNRAGKAVLAAAFAGALVFSGTGIANAFPTNLTELLGPGSPFSKINAIETDVSYDTNIDGKHIIDGATDFADVAEPDEVRVNQKQRLTLTYTFHEAFGPAHKGNDGAVDPVVRADKVLGKVLLDLDFLKKNAKDLKYKIDIDCDSLVGGCGTGHSKYVDAVYKAQYLYYGKKDLTGTDVDSIDDMLTFIVTKPLEAMPATRDVEGKITDDGAVIPAGTTIKVEIDFTAAKKAEGAIHSAIVICIDRADFGWEMGGVPDGGDPDGVCGVNPNSKHYNTKDKPDSGRKYPKEEVNESRVGSFLTIPIDFLAPEIDGKDAYGPVCRPGTEMFDVVNHEEELALWVEETREMDQKIKVGNFNFYDNKDRAHATLQEAIKAMTDNGYITDKTEVVKMKMEYISSKDDVKSGKKDFRVGLRAADSELCKKPKEPVIPAPVHTTIIQKIDVPKDKQQKNQKTIQGG